MGSLHSFSPTTMNDQEATQQIKQMENFILKEAQDKSEEIESKGLEEFGIEKFRIVTSQKEKIRQQYATKAKQVQTQCAIARSLAINKSRLEKIKARQEVLMNISKDSQQQLQKEMGDAAKNKAFVTKLIVQGLLMLLEDTVSIRCRAADVAMVEGCLPAACDEYAKLIQKDCGVVLSCQNNTIVVDNTVDVRLLYTMEQDKPAIRKLLFPVR